MKEIKAYIRTTMIDRVVRALEEAGASNLTVIDVKAIWRDMRPEDLLFITAEDLAPAQSVDSRPDGRLPARH